MVMIRANIHDVKVHLSEYLGHVVRGERVVICKRNMPVAEIRAIPLRSKSFRPVGLAKQQFEVPKEFFAPLPDDITKTFYSEDQ